MEERQYRKHEIIKIIQECSARLRYNDYPIKGRLKRQHQCDGIKELELSFITDFDSIVEDLHIRKKKDDTEREMLAHIKFHGG